MRHCSLLLTAVLALESGCASHPIPHSRLVECPSHSLGASLGRNDRTGNYQGMARDNYQSTNYALCTYTPQAIRCEGQWSFSKSPSTLLITRAAGGKLTGRLTTASAGSIDLECVAGDESLGECVFNPGTSTCQKAPWDHRH